VVADRVPQGLSDRTALLRTVLAGRRVLLLLDNAKDSDQVRPLLPGNDSLVLVTSRSRLRGLSVRDGARLVTLDQMSPAEAITLLGSVIGAERVENEREAAVDLVESAPGCHWPSGSPPSRPHRARRGCCARSWTRCADGRAGWRRCRSTTRRAPISARCSRGPTRR
jgi:hypothetical protein